MTVMQLKLLKSQIEKPLRVVNSYMYILLAVNHEVAIGIRLRWKKSIEFQTDVKYPIVVFDINHIVRYEMPCNYTCV